VQPSCWFIHPSESINADGLIRSVTTNHSKSLGIREGDALVFAEDLNGTLSLSAFARLYRIHIEDEKTILYMDGLLPIRPARTVNDLGITITDTTTTIFRLDWKVFENALKSVADIDFSVLPIIEGKSPQEQAYIRELLQMAVMDDLLGPAGGPQEEIVGMSVRDRYLVGKLSPRTSDEGDNIDGLQGPSAHDENGNDGKAPSDLKPLEETGEGRDKAGRRSLPGEEFATAMGTIDGRGRDQGSGCFEESILHTFVPWPDSLRGWFRRSIGIGSALGPLSSDYERSTDWRRWQATTGMEEKPIWQYYPDTIVPGNNKAVCSG